MFVLQLLAMRQGTHACWECQGTEVLRVGAGVIVVRLEKLACMLR